MSNGPKTTAPSRDPATKPPTPPTGNAAGRTWLQGLAGLTVGLVFLWLAFRSTSWQQVQPILEDIHSGWLAIALVAYGLDLCLRIKRWQGLLVGIKRLSFKSVGQALLIGYAMNNVLPARLGELVRANFTGSRHGLSRTGVVASIAVERVLDGLIVVACLVIGRLFVAESGTLDQLMAAGGILFLSLLGTLWAISRSAFNALLRRMPKAAQQKLHSFRQGLSVMQGGLGQALALSALIWLLEGTALWAMLNAVGVYLGWQQMLSVIGVVSLSTLLPSPPGFVGTYQYAFVLIIGLMGYTAAQGIAAATATQLFLLGSVTLCGLSLYTYTHIAAEKPYDG